MARKKRTKYACYLPADIVQQVRSLIEHFSFKESDCYNIISFLRKIYGATDYCPVNGKVISSVYYRKLLRGSYKKDVFQKLINWDLLVQVEAAKKNSHAASYRLGTKDDSKLERVEYYEIFENTTTRQNKKRGDSKIHHVGKSLNKLKVDIPSLEELEEIVKIKIKSRITDGFYRHNGSEIKATEDFKAAKTKQLLSQTLNTLDQLNSDTHLTLNKPSRNKTNKRLDHAFTRASDFMMEWFTYDGEKLVEIDIVSCQPTLLVALMERKIDDKVIKALSDKGYDFTGLLDDIVKGSSKARYPKGKGKGSYKGASSYPYKGKNSTNMGFSALTKESTLYRKICTLKGWDDNNPDNIRKAKEYAFSCMYGSLNPKSEEAKEKDAFMKHYFPVAYHFCRLFKETMIPHFEDMKKKDNSLYRKLATKFNDKSNKNTLRSPRKMASVSLSIFLQRLESYIVIDKVLPDLKRRNIPVITKHDSIVVPASYKERAMNVMTCHLNKYLGDNSYELRFKK